MKTKSATRSLKKLKQNLKKRLKVGVSRIRFKPDALKLINGSVYTSHVSNTLARDLCKKVSTHLTVIPRKRRLYKIHYKKKKLVLQDQANTKVSTKKKPQFIKTKLEVYASLRQKLKIKDIYKDLNSVNYRRKKKLTNDKKLHMTRIRSYRKILKQYRQKLGSEKYRRMYLRVKGNYYPSPEVLLNDIKLSHELPPT